MDLYETDRLVMTWLKHIKEELIPSRSDKLTVSTKKNYRDLVTVVDKSVEKYLRERIMEHFPEAEIIGEESNKKWSELWYIFIPAGYTKTLAEMTEEERKNRQKISSVDAFLEFANWYKSRKRAPILQRKH